MPSALGHTVAALAIGSAFPRRWIGRAALATGVALAVLPDADVLGWRLGVPYESLFGHRGITHSLSFAAAAAAVGTAILARASRTRGSQGASAEAASAVHGHRAGWLFAFLFVAAASHGLLDAATDGGRGIAFFAPFNEARYFFPFRPIAVSPLNPVGFFSERGATILRSEALWIGLPSAALAALSWTVRRIRASGSVLRR